MSHRLKGLSPLVYLHSQLSERKKGVLVDQGWSSTCYRWCETSSLLKVTSESARWLWPGGKERRFGAQHARTRLALVGSYDAAAFAGDDAELTDWLLLANQVKCFGSCQAKKSQLYGSSTYSSYRAEQRSDCERRCSPLWFEMLAHGERWHKIKSFHNGCLRKYDTSGQKSVEQRALNTDKVLTAARACARIAPGWASPGKHERGRPQKHGGKAEGGTRGHAAAVTKHPHTLIRHLSVFTSEKLRLYKTLLLGHVTCSSSCFYGFRVYFLAVCCSITTLHVTLNWKWAHSKISQLKHFIYFLL